MAGPPPLFLFSQGVRQGSVLSLTLFLLVINPILLELNRRSSGPSICGLYLGAFAHADDICTLATNITDCKSQISYISEYISSQGLALNVDKREATISPSFPADSTHIQAGDVLFPLINSAKCLGALWTPIYPAPDGLKTTSRRPDESCLPKEVGCSTAL